METTPPNPPRSKLVRFVVRPLFLLIGTLSLCATAYQLVMNLAFHANLRADSPIDHVVLPLVHLIAVVFFPMLLLWVLRRLKWFDRFWNSLFTWRGARRALVVLAIFATLTAVFYAEENWRGKRTWENCMRDLEARGEVLDWAALVPPPIPDEQNIIKAPKMTEWFVKSGPTTKFTNELGSKMMPGTLFKGTGTNARPPILIARMIVGPPDTRASTNGDVVVRFGAPGERERLGNLMQATIGSSANAPQGVFTLTQHPLDEIKPVRIVLQTDQQLSVADLSPLFPPGLISSNIGHLRVEAEAEANSFRLVLAVKLVMPAEEYLTFTDALAPEFELIQNALRRPQIRMDGDFQRPFEMPIVNFVFMRSLAQTLAARAQCCLLLGKPEQAVRELALLMESRRFLTTKPTTLVAAMIDVAICGLYLETIAEGFRMQAWGEPELVALQKQLQQINLPPAVVDAFRAERAAISQTFQSESAKEIVTAGSDKTLLEKLTNPAYLLVKFAPRGWIYQNLATLAPLQQTNIEMFNPNTQFIDTRKAESAVHAIEALSPRWSPYTALFRIAVPNYTRAAQTLARNQSRVNQALIACGLGRYRYAHGNYPETLDALVPQFVAKLPHDIIGGQPLHYRRTSDGQFELYSVGWNGTDDGGKPGPIKNGAPTLVTGDWVWGASLP